ncbi:MAG: glycoside hydrolase family 1 protein [Brevinema sp.]
MNFLFPQGFWWGTASSGPQNEGATPSFGKEPSIWDIYFEHSPNRFFNGVGPAITSDFYRHYKDDLTLMKEIGLNSYRTSIQWSRLLPYGTKTPNPEAVNFYNNVIDTMIEQGIEPFMNLHHYDLPYSIQEKGGWENRETVELFNFFAKTCFELFGDRVKKWFTFNEPSCIPRHGYLDDSMYPNVINLGRAMTVAYHVALAHAYAVQTYKKGNYSGRIGTILLISPVYARSSEPSDQKAQHFANLFYNESFKQPNLLGVYPQQIIDFMNQIDAPIPIKVGDPAIFLDGKVDLLGLNYYYPLRVKAKEHLVNPEAPKTLLTYYDAYEMPGRKINPHRGWEIYEKGIYDALIDIRDNFGNIDVFIGENGMGVENEGRFRNQDGLIEDDYRIDFLKSHLKWVHKAIQEGCNCKGFHIWSFADCWSWQNAYKNRYGLVEVNLENNLSRRMKKSAFWMKEIIKNNGFSA